MVKEEREDKNMAGTWVKKKKPWREKEEGTPLHGYIKGKEGHGQGQERKNMERERERETSSRKRNSF